MSVYNEKLAPSERSKRARDLRNKARGKAAYESANDSSSASDSDSDSDDVEETVLSKGQVMFTSTSTSTSKNKTSSTATKEQESSDSDSEKESTLSTTPAGTSEHPVEMELDDEGLQKLGIQAKKSKRGNDFFQVIACPSKGPFLSVGDALNFMKGKYYRGIQSETAKMMNGPITQESLDKKKAKSTYNKEKLTQKRKLKHSNLTEEQIAQKKAKFQRKKQRRLERKATGGITKAPHNQGKGKSTTFEE